jgi:predicted PurR-regulated permease PerM
MASGDLYKRKLLRIVGPSMSEKKTTIHILTEIDRQIAQFLWARIAISVAVGSAMWVAFRLLGLEDAGVWGVLSGLLFGVPIAGPLLVIVGAGLAGFVQFGMTAAAAGVASIIAALEGYVLTPVLMSRVGEMNAVAVFISLMFWGWIWGIWGLLLAVPMTAAIKAICERVDDLQPFAELLKA